MSVKMANGSLAASVLPRNAVLKIKPKAVPERDNFELYKKDGDWR
jgi:hypothetical protein